MTWQIQMMVDNRQDVFGVAAVGVHWTALPGEHYDKPGDAYQAVRRYERACPSSTFRTVVNDE